MTMCASTGMEGGESLLFRFGETEGWTEVAQPLGTISLGQAYQCRRKSDLIRRHPAKAEAVDFSFPLWDQDEEEPYPGDDHGLVAIFRSMLCLVILLTALRAL